MLCEQGFSETLLEKGGGPTKRRPATHNRTKRVIGSRAGSHFVRDESYVIYVTYVIRRESVGVQVFFC